MITIEEDIAKSAHWHTIDDGAPWRDVCYRLALEVERLRSVTARLTKAVAVRMSAEDPTADERLELLRAYEAARDITQ